MNVDVGQIATGVMVIGLIIFFIQQNAAAKYGSRCMSCGRRHHGSCEAHDEMNKLEKQLKANGFK